MKKIFICSMLLMLSLAAGAQKVKPVQYGGMCQYHKTVDAGNQVFEVVCNGYGKNEALAKEDAEVRVIRMVLYTGMPGHCDALLSNDNGALDNFMDSKQYKDFIMSNTMMAPLAKDKGAKTSKGGFKITVNVGGLDKWLMKNNYKSFGF